MSTHSEQPTAHTLPGYIKSFTIPYKGRRLGPYYARCWKEKGKLKKQYIKPEDLRAVRAAIQRHRELRAKQREVARQVAYIRGNLMFLRRMERQSKRSLLSTLEEQHLQRIRKEGIATQGRPPLERRKSFMSPSLESERNQTQTTNLTLILQAYAPADPTKDEQSPPRPPLTSAPPRETRKQLDQQMDEARADLRQRVLQSRKERPRPRPWYQPFWTPDWLTEEMVEEICNLALPPKDYVTG